MSRVPVISAVLAIALLLAGCVNAPAPPPPLPTPGPSADVPVLGPEGAPGCQPPSPVSEADGFPEIQGTGVEPETTLYALIMAPHGASFPVGEELKFVVRMTGSGDLAATLIDPSGASQALLWGPEAHGGSTYQRPGSEWGLGFAVGHEGCWELRLSTASSGGSFWFEAG